MIKTHPVIRHAEPEDIPSLVELFSRNYQQHKPAAYFEWQFFSREMPTQLIVAVSEEKIVGSFGLMARPLTGGLRCAQAMDMLLDLPFRSRGLFRQMVEIAVGAFSNLDLIVVLANRNGMQAVTGSLGWTIVAQVPVYTSDEIPSGQCEVCDISAGLPMEKDSRFRIFYDEAVENWRFNTHPLNCYHCLKKSGVRGYLKVFIDPANDNRRIGDIMYLTPASLLETISWLKAAYAWLRTERVLSCGLWSLPGSIVAEAAKRTGLIQREQERWLCVKPLHPISQDLMSAVKWDVCAADAEFY